MPQNPGIGFYLKVLTKLQEQHMNEQLQDRDLTFGQSKLLMILGGCPEYTASMKELEEHFRSAQSTVCGIVSRMEKKGLVEALPTGADKRVKRIRLTQAGVAMRQECVSGFEQSDAWLAQALTEEEYPQLLAMLRRMCEEKWRAQGCCSGKPEVTADEDTKKG